MRVETYEVGEGFCNCCMCSIYLMLVVYIGIEIRDLECDRGRWGDGDLVQSSFTLMLDGVANLGLKICYKR